MSTQTNGLATTLKTMGMTEAELEALTAPKSAVGVDAATTNGTTNGTTGQGSGQGQFKGGVRVDVGTGKVEPKEPETPEQELARLRAENTALKAKRAGSGTLTLHVSEKGALSCYGLGRFPVTLYREQWVKLLGHGKAILEFAELHSVTPEVRTVDGVPVSRRLVAKGE